RAESVDQDHGRSGSGIDDAESSAVDGAVHHVKSRARGIALLGRDGSGAACRAEDDQQDSAAHPVHGSVWSARRAIITIKGCELHTPAMLSPSPEVRISCDSSITSI